MSRAGSHIDKVVACVRRDMIPVVNKFRLLQDDTGRVVRSHRNACRHLDQIEAVVRDVTRELAQEAFYAAFIDDLYRWRTAGLAQRPDFFRTQRTYQPGPDGSVSLLIAPMVTTNGPSPVGYRLECLLSRVDEPVAVGETRHRLGCLPLACTFVRFVAGSWGFSRGNCIVAFSESVATKVRDHKQYFALFLMNKFGAIYQHETMPPARRLFGSADALYRLPRWLTDHMAPPDCYAARCVWAAAHEHYHQVGPLPLRDNLQLKRNWSAGLLEELKVDAQVALAAEYLSLPYGPEVLEFVVLDRMLRYPRHRDAVNNFDAGTGIFLFEWLAERGVIRRKSSGRLEIDLTETRACLDELVKEVLRLETMFDAAYLAGAETLVRTLLPQSGSGTRFTVPRRFAYWTGLKPPKGLLVFDGLDSAAQWTTTS